MNVIWSSFAPSYGLGLIEEIINIMNEILMTWVNHTVTSDGIVPEPGQSGSSKAPIYLFDFAPSRSK